MHSLKFAKHQSLLTAFQNIGQEFDRINFCNIRKKVQDYVIEQKRKRNHDKGESKINKE